MEIQNEKLPDGKKGIASTLKRPRRGSRDPWRMRNCCRNQGILRWQLWCTRVVPASATKADKKLKSNALNTVKPDKKLKKLK